MNCKLYGVSISVTCKEDICVADSVENLMKETHELGGSDVVVDRATPKARLFRAYFFLF